MDKNKIIEAAAKLIAKGAYDKAIREYQRILDSDPKDVRILQKMGELYLKKNDTAQAVASFSRVAESYSSDGFFLKAVAMYKQVLKINPNLIEVNSKLAELHQQLGLMSEAMAYFQIVANAQDKAGDVKASLDTLKKMVDLDPENVASRIKLAELYAREKMNAQAATEFKKAADYLKKVNRGDDYLRVAERLSALEPENVALARELAQAYLSRSDQKRALAKLQVCFKADPRDVETLTLLGQAFLGLGQTSKTVSVYKELAKLASESNRPGEANGWWAKIEQLDPNDPDLVARKAPPAPPPAARPGPQLHPSRPAAPAAAAPPGGSASGRKPAAPPAPPPATATPAPRKDQLAKLLTETDVYLKYGLYEKALDHLRRVFAADAESLDAHEKAYQIYVAARQGPQAAEQLLNVLRLCTRRAEVARAQIYLDTLLKQTPNHPELPAFLAVLRPGADAGAREELGGDEAIIVDPMEDEIVVEPELEGEPAGVDLALESAASHDDHDLVVEDAPADEPLGDEPLTGMGDEPLALASDEEPVLEPEPVQDLALAVVADDVAGGGADDADDAVVDDVIDDVADEAVVEEPAPLLEDPEPLAFDGGRTEQVPAYQLEPVEEDPALLAAEDSAAEERVVEDAPLSAEEPPPFDAEPAPLEVSASGDLVAQTSFDDPSTVITEDASTWEEEPVSLDDDLATEVEPEGLPPAPPRSREERVYAPPDEDPLSEECDEATFFLEQGLTEEAREILETVLIASPGHARASELLARLEQMEIDRSGPAPAAPAQAPAEEKDAFDLAAELADELGEMEEAAPEPIAPSGGDYQVSVEEVFSEFKKGLAKVVKPEDVDTHYDLGIAYKEMGLTDDAISEFSVAREGCTGKKKEIDCLSMIGLLQLQKGDGAAGVASFKLALANANATGEVAKGLLYDLATAHELAGSPGKALFCFQHVAQLDAGFRDVAAQVQRLSAEASPEPDELPNGAPPNGKPPPRSPPTASSSAPRPSSDAPPAPKSRKVGYL